MFLEHRIVDNLTNMLLNTIHIFAQLFLKVEKN